MADDNNVSFLKNLSMPSKDKFEDGYYWARHADGTRFIVLYQWTRWYCCGVRDAMKNFNGSQVICAAKPPEN